MNVKYCQKLTNIYIILLYNPIKQGALRMREAFTYMFKDPMFGKKAFTYWSICFLTLLLAGVAEAFKAPIATQTPTINSVSNPFLTTLPLVSIFLFAILGGYYFSGVKAIFEQKNNIVLPFINTWKNFVKGVKFGIAQAIPILILVAIIYSLATPSFTTSNLIFATVLAIIFCTFYFIYSNIFYLLFANEGKFFTYFRWKKACETLKIANKKIYFRNLFLVIFVDILGGLLSSLFTYIFNLLISNHYAAWIITSAEGALIAGCTAFVTMYLVAKSIEPETVV